PWVGLFFRSAVDHPSCLAERAFDSFRIEHIYPSRDANGILDRLPEPLGSRLAGLRVIGFGPDLSLDFHLIHAPLAAQHDLVMSGEGRDRQKLLFDLAGEN